MCDSMPILDEDFNFNEINLDFLESPPRPKRTAETSELINIFGNEGQTQAGGQPILKSNSTRNSMQELAKRISEVDTLVSHVHKVEKERDDFKKQLEDFHQTAEEVQLLYANEKQKRIVEEGKTKELTEKCDLLDAELTAKTLEVDQLQAQLDSLKAPLEYNDLVVRYLRLVQQQDGDRPLHWHDQAVVKDLYKYCKEKCLKVQPIAHRSPRKRKASTLKIDAEVQCESMTDSNSVSTANKELKDKNTQCVTKTRDQGCQHIGTTTTRSTTTACFFKYHDVGVNCNLWDMKYALNELLNDVRSWSTSVAPLSPIADLNTYTDETITANTSLSLSPIRATITKPPSPPPPRIEFKTVGTCTYICNVQRSIDFVAQIPTIKRSNSRPPSTLMFEPVKNENSTTSTPCSPLSLDALNQQLPPTQQMLPIAFDELWQIFGHMLYGLLHRKNNISFTNKTPMPSNITNQQEFYNWLQTLCYNNPAAGGIQNPNRDASANRNENSNRQECLSTAESLLEHQHSQCNLASPLNFSNAAPVKCTSSGQQILKPKAQKNTSNRTDDNIITDCSERQSVGTSPIRCIASSPIWKETNILTYNSIHQSNESSSSGIVEYSYDIRTPSAFTSPNSTNKPEAVSKYNRQIDETAKKILELFPLVNDRNSTLQSVQNLLRKNWKICRRKVIENRKRKRLLNSSSESGSETAVDFIAKLDCFIEQKNNALNNNEDFEENCLKDAVYSKPRKRRKEKLVQNINKYQRKTLKCMNLKNLHDLNHSLFENEKYDTDASDCEMERELGYVLKNHEANDIKPKNLTENSNVQNCLQEKLYDNMNDNFNNDTIQSCEGQRNLKTNNINTMHSDKQQNAGDGPKIQIQSNVPIYTKTKMFSKVASNSSTLNDFSKIETRENIKELLRNKIDNPMFSTDVIPKINKGFNSVGSDFQNTKFENFGKNLFNVQHKNKRKCFGNLEPLISPKCSPERDENCIQYKKSLMEKKSCLNGTNKECLTQTDILNSNVNERVVQQEDIINNSKKEFAFTKSRSKEDFYTELDNETICTSDDNPTEEILRYSENNPESLNGIANKKTELLQNVFHTPKLAQESTLNVFPDSSPLSDTSSNESLESRLIIVSDVDEMTDSDPMHSIAKKRGRKRKSESSSPTNSNLAVTAVPCKRSQRLLAKQKIREDQITEDKSLFKPIARKDTKDLNIERGTVLVKENSLKKDFTKVSENLKLETLESNVEKSLQESPKDISKCISSKINDENRIENASTKYECIATDKNSTLSINSDSTLNRITYVSSPASPTPWDSGAEIDDKPVTEIPVELVRQHRCLKRRSKSLLHNFIDNYEASKYRSFNQMVLKSHEETLINQLEAHFKEYFAVHPKNENATRDLVELLLATSKDLKLIAHAACTSSQDASRCVQTPYENLKNLSVPLLDRPAPSSISINMTDVMRELLVHQPEFKDIILAVIESKIFNVQNADTLSLNVALNLTDLYLLILSVQQLPQKENPARLFIAKCLYYHRMKATPMIYAVLCAFPTTLPHREERKYDRSDPLITVIQHVLMCTSYNMENHELFHRELLSKLRYVYHFEVYKPDFQDVIQNLVEKLRAGKTDNLKYAFAIFCKRLPPERVVRDVIQGHLIPLSNEYYNNLQYSKDYDVRAAALLDCFSSVIKPFPRDSSSPVTAEINNYMNIFTRFLSIVDRPIVQEGALHAILRLQRFSNINCYNALVNFRPNYDLSPYIQAAVKTFIHRKPLSFWKSLQSG